MNTRSRRCVRLDRTSMVLCPRRINSAQGCRMLRALTVHDRFNPRRCRSLRHPLLYADLVLNQEVDQGLAVDQSDRPVMVSWLLLADPENPALKVSDLSFFIR